MVSSSTDSYSLYTGYQRLLNVLTGYDPMFFENRSVRTRLQGGMGRREIHGYPIGGGSVSMGLLKPQPEPAILGTIHNAIPVVVNIVRRKANKLVV